MIKLEDLLKEAEQEQLDEASVKSWIGAAAIGLGSLFNMGKAQTTDTLKLNMSTLFPSGKHIIRDESKLKELEAQIAGFMSKDATADYTFRITAMSSKVPDYDGEKPNRPKVDAKFLPHERATEVQEELEEFVQNAKQTGAFKGNVTFQVIEKPGEGPEWHPEKGDKKDDPEFTKHQGVKLDVISHTKEKTSDVVTNQVKFEQSGEIMHKDGKRAVAVIFYATEGGAGNKDVLMKVLKQETSVIGNIDEKGVYVDAYYIKAADWNTITSVAHDVSTAQFNALKAVGKRVPPDATTVAR